MKHVLVCVTALWMLSSEAPGASTDADPVAGAGPEKQRVATPVAPDVTPEELVRKIGAAALVQDALQTQVRHVKAGRTLAGDIPANLWGEAITRLKPIRVYLHRVNVVAVLKADAGREEGLYIYIPISSYLPRNGDDGFAFTKVDRDIQKFSRNTKIPIKP